MRQFEQKCKRKNSSRVWLLAGSPNKEETAQLLKECEEKKKQKEITFSKKKRSDRDARVCEGGPTYKWKQSEPPSNRCRAGTAYEDKMSLYQLLLSICINFLSQHGFGIKHFQREIILEKPPCLSRACGGGRTAGRGQLKRVLQHLPYLDKLDRMKLPDSMASSIPASVS